MGPVPHSFSLSWAYPRSPPVLTFRPSDTASRCAARPPSDVQNGVEQFVEKEPWAKGEAKKVSLKLMFDTMMRVEVMDVHGRGPDVLSHATLGLRPVTPSAIPSLLLSPS